MMDLDSMRVAFVQEMRELLSEMEAALLDMERNGPDDERIHAVFRDAHTIKGSAGIFDLDHVVGFTHAMENALDQVRNGTLACDPDAIGLFIACCDHLQLLATGVEKRTGEGDLEPETRAKLVERLKNLSAGRKSETSALAPLEPINAKVEVLEGVSGHPVDSDAWHISLRPAPSMFSEGLDPVALLRYLTKLGTLAHVETIDDTVPMLSELKPDISHLGFEIALVTTEERNRITEAFEFLPKGSVLRLIPPHARIDAYIQLLEDLPESNARLGELLLACKALTEDELESALRMQGRSGDAREPLGQILIKEQIVPPPVVAAALDKQRKRMEQATQESRLVKVEAGKLDRLIDFVGELVIAAAAAKISARKEKARASEEAISNLSHLVESIRDSALGLRMAPVGEVFNRFPRLVRDLSRELGKTVSLEVSGAETELDKALIDKLADPLTHIVRNSLDHGIESREARIAAGKPPGGTLRFDAYHETGSIVIEVSDDGGGISRAKVLQRAIDRGLVPPNQELSSKEILDLIFEPGFSTAEQVTNLSGRGVGMDVVRKTIQGLRGEIDLVSEEGVGTTLQLRLPLTLAIIDGFLVGVKERSFVVPLDMVVECADFPTGGRADGEGRHIVALRGEALPLIHLRDLFGLDGPRPIRESIVVVEYGGHRAGLVVDRLLGEFQTVIKPLSHLFSGVRGIGGSTILGTGEVALILDVPALVQRMERLESSPTSQHLLQGASA